MAVPQKNQDSILHWNYFLALEQDLAEVSRYVEFTEDNYNVYSIELVKLLLASCSEIDVVLKKICENYGLEQGRTNIGDYRDCIQSNNTGFPNIYYSINKFGLNQISPWEAWKDQGSYNPLWWEAYNAVKHNRGLKYYEANLKNVINSMTALCICCIELHTPNIQVAGATRLNKPQLIQVNDALEPLIFI